MRSHNTLTLLIITIITILFFHVHARPLSRDIHEQLHAHIPHAIIPTQPYPDTVSTPLSPAVNPDSPPASKEAGLRSTALPLRRRTARFHP